MNKKISDILEIYEGEITEYVKNNHIDVVTSNWTEIISYFQSAIQFFFITMAFGYFANHLHQREFKN